MLINVDLGELMTEDLKKFEAQTKELVNTIMQEGNTNKDGSREGNQVCRKRRPKAQIHSVSRYIV